MTPDSTSDSSSIFKDGKLKPGIYKIQNVYTETYLDIEVHSREMCCRPAKDLGEGRGLWEIEPLWDGYTVQRVDRGKPGQFCIPLNGVQDWATLRVAAYPVAWRVELVNDDRHRGFEYVRFYWGTERIVWDLGAGKKENGAPVITYPEKSLPWQIWRLIPTKIGGTFTPPHPSLEPPEPGSLPSYEGAAGQFSTRARHAESERDEFGTIVTEVSVLTTTTTTRKRYRVEDA